jgi:tRNA U34 5-carboxymethylaminomethyl modifying enzyme MnmG/GidA
MKCDDSFVPAILEGAATMDDFLETLKIRAADAQKRMQEAQQRLGVVQAEFQAAAQEFNSWNHAVITETRKLQQLAIDTSATPSQGVTAKLAIEPPVSSSGITKNESNKTEVVRVFLKDHPSGATPKFLWEQLGSQLGYRAYLYSVLKRLKDKDQVHVRRGKYFYKHQPQPEENQSPNGIVQ